MDIVISQPKIESRYYGLCKIDECSRKSLVMVNGKLGVYVGIIDPSRPNKHVVMFDDGNATFSGNVMVYEIGQLDWN